MSNVTATKTQEPSQRAAEISLKSKPQRRVLQERTGSEINKAKSGQQKQSSLIGSKGFLQISKDAKSNKSGGGGSLFVFKDENADVKVTKNSPAKSIHAHVQTVLSGDYGSVIDADVAFYKELAEKRREALDESLKENESLVMENDELRLENAELKSENESLQESVEKARKITDMLAPILANSDDEDEEEEKEDTESDEALTEAKESHDKDEEDEATNSETAKEAQPEESNQDEH